VAAPAANLSRRAGTGLPETADPDPVCLCQLAGAALNTGRFGRRPTSPVPTSCREHENWQSEFLQLFSFVVLASLFIHKGSAESKDSDEQVQKSLDRIEKRLKALERDDQSKAKSR
jgi:hypothetical protein